MESMNEVIQINASQRQIYSVLFMEDGKQVFGGNADGVIGRWQVDDGHSAGELIRIGNAQVFATALSLDRKWLVCGLYAKDGGGHARVWSTETHTVFDVKGCTSFVLSVDVSPDSGKFATSGDGQVSVWSLPSGQIHLGPLKHDGRVVAVRFSPDGSRIATATQSKSIRVYDSDGGQQLLDIPFNFHPWLSSPLSYSSDGLQLFAVSCDVVKCFDASSGSFTCQWSVPRSQDNASIIVSSNKRFVVIAGDKLLSFWDTSTGKQLGNVIEHASRIWSIALSPSNDRVAIGEENGMVTLRNLCCIFPDLYFSIPSSSFSLETTGQTPTTPSPQFRPQFPFTSIDHTIFDLWKKGDLVRTEERLAKKIADPSHRAETLAHLSLVRSRLKLWDAAIDDAKKSIELGRSVIGHIAYAIAHVYKGEYESGFDVFDSVFSLSAENDFLLLIKAALLFECGRHDSAISRVDQLIGMVREKSLYITVRAQMFHILGGILLREGDVQRAVELLRQAEDAIPFQLAPFLTLVSLLFGWDFARLDDAIRANLQRCVKPIEDLGDAAVTAKKPEEAIQHYSTALSLGPSNPASVLVKRSRAYVSLKSWAKVLADADEAIKADPTGPWAYETRYVAHCGLGRIDDACEAFDYMLSLAEGSTDEDVRQLAKKYIPPSTSVNMIDDAILEVSKASPFVLIDIKSGCLCDEAKRRATFKSEHEFRELLSSIIQKLDKEQIQQAVSKYFEYVTLSHVWEEMEPSFQDVNAIGTIWELDWSLPLNDKLQRFCGVVRTNGYRWAWSDTCCIDKTISTVLNQSVKMMHLWYKSSAATFVFLGDVELPSTFLKDSKWLTRAWTSLELLSPKVIRFYTRSWEPYRGDMRRNHKESPEIMQELADAIGIASKTIISFNPDDLTVRQRLRLASTRSATREEDLTYSLIGIFKSDIQPDYGEGYAALGHLLEEIVSRSGDVTVMDWTGKSSQYNSCLPNSLAVYSQPPATSPSIESAEMDAHIATLRRLLPQTDTTHFYSQITCLPPVRFVDRRLHLPCIIFTVRRLGVQTFGGSHECRYRARVSGIGDIEFRTSDKLSLEESQKLIFVYPWIRNLCNPPQSFNWGSATENQEDSDEFTFGPDDDESTPSSPLHDSAMPASLMDEYTQALRLVARLQQPFHALLLQHQSSGEFRRVAAEHEIAISGIRREVNFAKDVRVSVVEVS